MFDRSVSIEYLQASLRTYISTAFDSGDFFMSMYIGNLSYQVTPEILSSVFPEGQTVKSVQIPTDRETGRSRGFGYVEMD